MFEKHLHPDDIPLFSNDLKLCQQIFDIIRSEKRIEPGSARSDLIAAYIIHAYKQGTRDVGELLIIARSAAIFD